MGANDLEIPLIPAKKSLRKKSHRFFGLIDTRRALFVLNIMSILLAILAILYWIELSKIAQGQSSNSSYSSHQISTILQMYPYMIALYAVTTIASLSAIIGAMNFQLFYIVIASIIYIIQVSISTWQYILLTDWIALGVNSGITLLWMYPMAMFAWEVYSGSLTKANYEPNSICCSRNRKAGKIVPDVFPYGGGI